ncbi:right-handed parallel beta-helix repeat-containing protein [Streptomyces sp. NPDC018031]|uniref:right-handed parallel beta-helix repeat-containing protein n=1 Tax=Streptomyces sp. NPDC018031 TaxID=3365033 RepID=UPI00379AF659
MSIHGDRERTTVLAAPTGAATAMRRRRRYRGRHRKDRTLPLGSVVIAASAAAGVYLTAAPGGASAADVTVYVSTTGSDSASGGRGAPYRTLEKALEVAEEGTTIEVRGGTYRPAATLRTGADGTPGNRIVLKAYGSEKVVVDGGRLAADSSLLELRGDYWTVSGIEFRNSPANAVVCTSCTGDVFEQLSAYSNGGTGLVLRGAGTRYNVVRDVDAYGNRDPASGGRFADGIAFGSGSGEGNVVTGARLYGNADDGLDLRSWPDPVTVEHSWASRNGDVGADLGTFAVSRGNIWDAGVNVPSAVATDGAGATRAPMR